MTRRLLDVATILSAAMAAVVLILRLCDTSSISIRPDVHVGVWSGSRLAVFNNAEYGPYRGSLIGIEIDDVLYPPLKHQAAWGDAVGIYYRYFEWESGEILWTLMVSLWYSLALFALLPTFWLIRNWSSNPPVSQTETPSPASPLANNPPSPKSPNPSTPPR